MPFLRQYRIHQVLKAKRAAALRGRPSWQDVVLPTPEGRDTYRIAAEHEMAFVRAFRDAMQELASEVVAAEIRRAWQQGSETAVIEAVPSLADTNDATTEYLLERIESAYRDVINASMRAEAARLKATFGVDLRPEALEAVEKAKPKAVPIVPVNPYSTDWIRRRSLALVTEGFGSQQRSFLRSVLADAFAKGIRAEILIDTIKSNIGLTDAWQEAVYRRRDLLEDQGYDVDTVERETAQYRDELLTARARRISRTETIAAQAHGRNVVWQMAQDTGSLPPVQRVWRAAPASPNPNRPCEICVQELDGQAVDLGQPYESATVGQVMHPPAHPNCRCTEVLVKKEA